MRYAIVIEKADGNYSAYVPDLPGCVATAATVKDTEREIRDAIRFHIDGLKQDGMITWKGTLKPKEVYEVASYIFTLRGTHPPNPKPPENQTPIANVTATVGPVRNFGLGLVGYTWEENGPSLPAGGLSAPSAPRQSGTARPPDRHPHAST